MYCYYIYSGISNMISMSLDTDDKGSLKRIYCGGFEGTISRIRFSGNNSQITTGNKQVRHPIIMEGLIYGDCQRNSLQHFGSVSGIIPLKVENFNDDVVLTTAMDGGVRGLLFPNV